MKIAKLAKWSMLFGIFFFLGILLPFSIQEKSFAPHCHDTNFVPYLASIEYNNTGSTMFDANEIKNTPVNLSIFGYALQTENESPITRDEEGYISLVVQSLSEEFTYVKVQIYLKFGIYEFDSIPVNFEIYKDLENKSMYTYSFDKPDECFFMNWEVQ